MQRTPRKIGAVQALAWMCLGLFGCTYIITQQIYVLNRLQVSGVSTWGTYIEQVPPKGRGSAYFRYDFDLGSSRYAGKSSEYAAILRPENWPSRLGDPVVVYYLPSDPSVNRAGSPTSQLLGWYGVLLLWIGFTAIPAYFLWRNQESREAIASFYRSVVAGIFDR